MLLLGFDRREWPVRSALRRVGVLIRELEEGGGRDAGHANLISSAPSRSMASRSRTRRSVTPGPRSS